jgi:type VI protein secretion system component Hcp
MNYYLKMVDGNNFMVKGGSKKAGHLDWIEVASIDWVANAPLNPTSSASATPRTVRLTILGHQPKVFQATQNGDHFPIVILDMDIPEHKEWYLFHDVLIESYQVGSSGEGVTTAASISLIFTSVEAHNGAYIQAAAAQIVGQAAKALTNVGLARLRRYLVH